MKKTAIFAILFLTLLSGLHSQVSFYLRPTVNMKVNQGKIYGTPGSQPIFTTMTNQYFSISTDRKFFDNNNINLGLHLGVKLKEKHFFELGMSTDNSGIRTQAEAANWVAGNPPVRFGGNHNSSSVGSPFTRLSFNYNNLFWKNKSKTLQLRSIVGFGSMYNHYVNRKKGIFVIDEVPAFALGEIDSNIFNTEYRITTTKAWRNALYLNVGLGFDFYTKKKNKYLFSFDLFYVQGTRNVQYEEHRIKILDHGKEVNFLYAFSSRGSGFYFMLTRRLQFYPWRPNKVKSL